MDKPKSLEEQSIVKFLASNISKSDIPNIENELKKDFILAKIKSRAQRNVVRKKKCRTLTRKEKATIGFYKLPQNLGEICFKKIEVMNSLWVQYMCKILELNDHVPNANDKHWESLTQSIYKADFHGINLTVVRSKCPSYVGVTGICIMDTKNTFKIVSQDLKVKTIPKKECVFDVRINNYTFTLMGKHFSARPAERSTKKIKTQLHPDLL